MISINCTNSGCNKYQEPYLDAQTNTVHCSVCGNPIIASHFLKVQLKATNQTKSHTKSAYSIRCDKCKKESTPKIANDKLVCSFCNIPANISKPFEILVRDYIKKGNQDI